ncbi:hypothetical protein GXN76_00780 [Kroppenstedtia pulmonis]|uniref:Uncharacterized protein n=1 Tax=Kroppenstedtia pulmonis TaxID=1380685 RepID=A0A7D4C473_9BACL|nr:hypothetical protein [Kroppenstedtia pulmonis]QKG83136.1 hypothetical protein GXN76_00780 [Kroppenstedtia pulmonis]
MPNTTERESMDSQLEELNNKLEQITNLLIKASYDTSINAFLLEDMFARSKDNKGKMERYHELATKYLQNRLEKEGLDQIGVLMEENEQLKRKSKDDEQRVQILKSQIQQLHDKEQQSGKMIREYQEQMKLMEQKKDEITNWTSGLVHELQLKYSRLRNNETIIQDYIQRNPTPKGIHL